MVRQKLVVFAPVRDLDTFAKFVKVLGGLSELFDISVEVGTLTRKHGEELTDPGDSYLDYSVNTPSIFKFVVPGRLRPYLDTAFAEENLALMDAKVEVLKEVAFKAAFFGNEPVYQRERVYEAFPNWRGPRIDHPRRSRNPVWSPCLLQPEVQEVYREAVAELCRRIGIIDTFLFKTNDAGSGFCYAPILYNRPNGPRWCRPAGTPPHVAAFHRVVVEGAREAGCQVETFMTNVRPAESAELCRPLLLEEAHLLPESAQGGTGRLAGNLSSTYPLRHMADPLGFLGQLERIKSQRPQTVLFSLATEYQKAHVELPTLELLVRLIQAFHQKPTNAVQDRLALLEEVARELYGPESTEAMVQAWYELHEYFRLRSVRPRPHHCIMYGDLSARWLTRPLVAFPEELTDEERSFWVPHVFSGFADEARLNILDIHGGRAGDVVGPSRDAGLRNAWFGTVDSSLGRAGRAFEAVVEKGVESAQLTVRAIAITRCLYRSARHALEFGLLLERSQPREGMWELGERHAGDPERTQVYQIVRDELDNALELIALVEEEGTDHVLITAEKPLGEDTFILGPDLVEQLRKKRRIMLAHWRDFDRIYLPPHL